MPFLGDRPETLALLLDAGTFAFSAFMVSRIAFPAPVRGLTGPVRSEQASGATSSTA